MSIADNQKDHLPNNLEELCDYIDKYSKTIYVREQIKGKWRAVALSNLPGDRAVYHALSFIKDHRIPIRFVDEETLA